MKNIFENAYFGKTYKTRDGRKAIFIQFDTIIDDDENDIGHLAYVYTLRDGEYSVALNGISTSENDIILHNINTIKLDEDIVSEWQEPIDEKELNELAKSHAKKELGYTDSDISNFNSWNTVAQAKFREVCEDFKAGYHKAKEE